ncbi:WASH complex subunit 2 isoform X1 [Entelurus aequoreus]|uniref:WASH complex subunit 2 isoform X1 n=1 Tax=Entelurus aequoreus TaxID=161455 RepID=UPI002B1D72A3|nr:WASH complex subunit 2 isoform X1 [Entelurus aequoreus]XP_061914182.1 WASH complex subunit 2 isoform X1 [Entelurus aequoreus]
MNGMPDGMANGPDGNEHSKKDAQIWERPWTLEEMRQSSVNWSLAADSGLFLFLQDFSQRMLSKTHEIEKQLDSLIRDTKATDSSLHSVFNDFLMLSNTQFIENRVYDDEVEEPVLKADAVEKQPDQKTREQKEAELIPKMQEAVNYGLKVLESAFEHLDIKAGNSDSEDEEANDRGEAILEAKDLYVDRPLPLLIGSQAFMEQDDVGLGDLSSDDMSVDSQRDSVIESDDGKDAENSDDDFMQEADDGRISINKKSSMLSYEEDEDDDEDSDIFGESDKDDDDAKSTGPSSFADELAARIKGELVSKPTGDRASLSSKKKGKGTKESKPANSHAAAEEDSDDMFKPPKMDDDDFSPFGGKSGLFSGGRGLFDDDDEGDLFSEAPKPKPMSKEDTSVNKSTKSTAPAAESDKPGKKIPPGAVSIFPDSSLFNTVDDLRENRENGAPTIKTHVTSKPSPIASGGLGGLFDEDDDDDFFGGRSLKSSSAAAQEKPKPPKAVDLFDEDDEDGDIFSEKYSVSTPAQNKKVEETVKPPEKKMPAGAISMFGPGTKSLLSEGLKRLQPSIPSEESEKSEKNGLVPDVVTTVGQTQKSLTSSLFSDDEDTQVFPTIPKSQSNPETTSQRILSKHHVSLFDDDEEDLFASASKSKSSAAKIATPQPSKAISSSLFSDDEDQWISPKVSVTKQENKTGGMKPSASAPSSLPSVTTLQKSSLFDEDDDDLFAPAKESSQKKPQKVSLLFEDEDDDSGSLFGSNPDDNTNKPTKPKSQEASDVKKVPEKPSVPEKPPVPEKAAVKPTETLLSSLEGGESKKKPVGAVSLFGGIDVFANKQTKIILDDDYDDNGPPPNIKTQEKVKSLSLFDDEEEDELAPIVPHSKPTTRDVPKPVEEQPQAKSTGVFLDEELLFSSTQQKDNDPDVDLFAPSERTTSAKLSSVKPATPSLFSEDEEDDLFSSNKPKTLPPKVAEKPSMSNDRAPLSHPEPEPVSEIQKPAPCSAKPKEPSSRIGKLQASLKINPSVLLPGLAPSMPGAVSVLPGLDPSSSSGVSSSSLSPSPATTPIGGQANIEGGVSFDTPQQASTLQSAHKSRVKGSIRRRPPSRAARQQAFERSVEEHEVIPGGHIPESSPDDSSRTPVSQVAALTTYLPDTLPPQPPTTEIPTKPSVPTPPLSTSATKQDSSKDHNQGKESLPLEEDDLFGSDSLFGSVSVTNTPATKPTTKEVQHQAGTGESVTKDKSNLPSIFDDNSGDLFQKVKSSSKTVKASPFLQDDDEDIFGVNSPTPPSYSSSIPKSSNSFSKQDIFEDDNVTTLPKVHNKDKDKPVDFSLFDDDVDIFADPTDIFTPKQKTKTKGATESIFDDEMDDIFSPSTVKPAAKATPKLKIPPPSQESSTATADSSSIFDDPLNALGRN